MISSTHTPDRARPGAADRPRSSRSTHRVTKRDRPIIALAAHRVDGTGGMERVCAELIRRAADRYRFVLISADVDPELREVVEWRRISMPRRPASALYLTYYARAALALKREEAHLRHAVGALVPNRVDLATVHFCHAGYLQRTGRKTPPDAPSGEEGEHVASPHDLHCRRAADVWQSTSGRLGGRFRRRCPGASRGLSGGRRSHHSQRRRQPEIQARCTRSQPNAGGPWTAARQLRRAVRRRGLGAQGP